MTESLVVRKLPAGLKQALRERAATHGRSVEAEVRSILMDAVFSDDFVLEWVEGTAALPPGDELPLPERGPGREPVAFE